MNKKNKILVGCLTLLLALSVGYALFSETITINGTATAKGNFDIGVTCQTSLANVPGLEGNAIATLSGPTKEGSFSGDTCTASGNTVTFNTNLNAPGAMRYYTIKVTNNGTIDAWAPVAASSTRNVCMSQEMKNLVGYAGDSMCVSNLFDHSDYRADDVGGSYRFEDFSVAYIIEKKDGTIVNLMEIPEEEAMSYLNEDGEKVKLDAGDSLYYVGKMYIPEDYQWNDMNPINMIDFNMTADYTLMFEQQTN